MSMTTKLNQRYLLRPQYASSYDLTAGNAPTLNVGSTKFQVDGADVRIDSGSYESVSSTSGVALSNKGTSVVYSSTAATFHLPAPSLAGDHKYIIIGSTTSEPTATRIVSCSTMSCTINTTGVTLTSTQFSGVHLIATSTNEWGLFRDLVAGTGFVAA